VEEFSKDGELIVKGPKGTCAESSLVAENDTANILVILNVVKNLCSQVLSSFASLRRTITRLCT